MISNKSRQLVSILVVAVTLYLSFFFLMPGKNWGASNSKTQFSTKSALAHLEQISKEEHYTGSEGLKDVRSFLVSELEQLGLEVEIQEQVAVNPKWGAATKAKNIIAKIKGSVPGKALLLLSHYDSNPHSSLGASDAGSGVVVILEGIKVLLASGQQPKNDLIICITDAEELGLLGANAFVNHHPWANDVGLVLNFEARGSGGPSFMLLETNGGNKKLIESFQEANVPYPAANSLMYSIYKMLPNDTDLTVFREDGDIDGFNFAFIDDHFDYHTAQDSFERMDVESLNHQASYLMATLNYFAHADLNNLKAESDLVYFNFPVFGMVYYPFSWVLPSTVMGGLLFLLLIIFGLMKKKLSLKGMLLGFIPLLASLLLSGVFSVYGWKLLKVIHPQYNDILHGFTYNGYYYIAFFVAISLVLCFSIYRRFLKNLEVQELLIAPLFVWLLICAGVSTSLKGAGFFIIPVIVLLAQLFILIQSKKKNRNWILFSFLVVPVLLIFAPMVKLFPVGLGLKMLISSAVFVVLLFGLLLPVFYNNKFVSKLNFLIFIIGIFAFGMATFTASYSEDQKKPNSIIYVHDLDEEKAYWASYNIKVDAFTKQFLGDAPIAGSYDSNTTASKYKTNIKIHALTEIRQLEKPVIEVQEDTIFDDSRWVEFKIESIRQANRIELLSKVPIQFKSLRINGEMVKGTTSNDVVFSVAGGKSILAYYISEDKESVSIQFEVNKDQVIDLDIMEAKYDLFKNEMFEIEPRSAIMMPMPFVLNDATILKMNLKLE